jgi:hypothetical protein
VLVLTIRAAQMDALHRDRDRKFVLRLAAYVRRREPRLVAGWSEPELVRGLTAAWRRAATYGIRDPLALAEFFAAMARHAADFDAHPEVHAVLRDPAIGPDHRIHVVRSRVSAQTWAEIARGRPLCPPFPPAEGEAW